MKIQQNKVEQRAASLKHTVKCHIKIQCVERDDVNGFGHAFRG